MQSKSQLKFPQIHSNSNRGKDNNFALPKTEKKFRQRVAEKLPV